MSVIHTEKIEEFRIEISPDQEYENPRKACTVYSRIATWHRRYAIGDEQPTIGRDEYRKKVIRPNAFVFEIRIYDHSGVSLALAGHGAGEQHYDIWDSGWLGYLWIGRREAIQCFGRKYTEEQVIELAKSELADLQMYVNGECYYYAIYDESAEDPEEMVDSSGGIWGLDYALEEARRMVHVLKESWRDARHLQVCAE